MKPTPPHQNLPDHDAEIENDALWNLLADASPSEASPRFVQDTLRRVRLEENPTKISWWKKLLAPKPLLGTAGAAIAAIAIFISLPSDPISPSGKEVTNTATPTEDWNELEDAIASELLSNAAEDPSLLSDSEIVALLF